MYRKIFLALSIILLFKGCNNKSAPSLLDEENSSFKLLRQSKNSKLNLNERFKLIDSAYVISKKTPLDSLHLAIISYKGNLYFKLKEKDSVFHYDNYLVRKASEISNYYYLGIGHRNIALHYDKIQSYNQAFNHFNLSKNYFLNFDDSSKVGRQLMSMGLIQKNQNDFFGSKETTTEALEYLHPRKDIKYIASAYNTLGTNHRKLLNFDEAIKYFNKAIEEAPSLKNKIAYKNNLAATYIDFKKYNDAINILEQIKFDTILKKTSSKYARILDNLAYAKWLSSDSKVAHEFQEALKLRKQNNDKRGQIASYTHLGEFYSKTDIKKAEAYFDSVIQLSKTLKIPRAEKDALKFLMTLKPKNISIRDRYVILQDSLYVQETKVKTQFAKYKYDDKQKQEAILRLEKEKAEKELEASQQRNQKIRSYTLGGVLVLLLSFIAYFFIQRSKRLKEQNKTAKLEATYETEASLSRKLHDDFGGKLNHAMVLLQNGANNEEVLNIVDGLYNQSRDFSREINDVDTGPNFKNFLFGMMGSYCKSTKLITTGSTAVDWLQLPPLSKKTLFKVLQELMINMQKHSDASLVSVVFEQSKKTLKISYLDNGVGASKKELNHKNGLWNTEKRIKAIGGTITFDSEKENGFQAQIEIPN